ncbi:MAG: winged helix-turn-helix domain-containing protein, partial [Oscillospiraceae bacterium]|nr:winged helix-turn-helix domain-containing protein [Oscillospiraceae bacterium]
MPDSFPLPVFTGDAPLYDQLYRHIAAAIQSGALAPGAKLPSKRRLCALAGVSMSTVETAYSLLAAEGYVLARPRSGYVCADLLHACILYQSTIPRR